MLPPPPFHSLTASLICQPLNVSNSILPQDLCTHHSLCLERFPSRSRDGLSRWVCIGGRTHICRPSPTILPCKVTPSLASSHPIRPISQIISYLRALARAVPRSQGCQFPLGPKTSSFSDISSLPFPPPLPLHSFRSRKIDPFEPCINSPLQASVLGSSPLRSFTSQRLQGRSPRDPWLVTPRPFALLYFLLEPTAP